MALPQSNHRRFHRVTHAAVVLLFVVMLSGCSSLQIAYSFADDVLEGRAADFLDLDEKGRADLAHQTEALFAWHQVEMLPKYAVFLTAQAEIAEAGGWSREELSTAFQTFHALADETIEGAAPYVADVLMDHTTPEKLEYLEAQMAAHVAERREEELAETPEQSIEKWVGRRVDRFERFTGDLTEDQIAIIRRYTADGMDNGLRWLDHSQRRNTALVDFLSSKPGRNAMMPFIHRLILHPYEITDPDYKAIMERRRAMRQDMYFEVLTSLSPDQRQTLANNLRDYAADMVSLAGV